MPMHSSGGDAHFDGGSLLIGYFETDGHFWRPVWPLSGALRLRIVSAVVFRHSARTPCAQQIQITL